MTEPSHAVFLSYASQDAEAAQKICDALRAAGIEVFLDQSELRGGDAWDQKIRREIHDCALFIPVISANTASRHEGYFRLEWDLADQRTHMIARSRVFVVPVCLDATTQVAADVPESFQRVQWTRLPGGVTPAAFVERVRRLLSAEQSQGPTGTESPTARVSAAPTTRNSVLPSWRSKSALLATIAVLVLALGYFVANRFVLSKRGAEGGAAAGACGSERSSDRLQPAAALDRGAAVRELKRRQGAGVLLRRAHRGAAQLARRDQRAAGRRAHLLVLVQRNTRTLPPLPTSSTSAQSSKAACGAPRTPSASPRS